MKRTEIKRKTELKRGAEIIPFNKATKQAAKFKRRPAKQPATSATAAAEHMAWVRTCECHVCGRFGPSEAHHVFHDRHSNRRPADWLTIPLCQECHREGRHAIHKEKRTWRFTHGPDYGYVPLYLQSSPVDGALTDGLDALARYLERDEK